MEGARGLARGLPSAPRCTHNGIAVRMTYRRPSSVGGPVLAPLTRPLSTGGHGTADHPHPSDYGSKTGAAHLDQKLKAYQRRLSAHQPLAATSMGSLEWPPTVGPAVMLMRPGPSGRTSPLRSGLVNRVSRSGSRNRCVSPLRTDRGIQALHTSVGRPGGLRTRGAGIYTVKSLGELSEASGTGWKPSKQYARLSSDVTDPSRTTASPEPRQPRRRRNEAPPPRPQSQASSTYLGARSFPPKPLHSRQLQPGDACEVFVRSKRAFVPAVVLELTVDEDGDTVAHVQHNLTLGGTVVVHIDWPTEFRPSGHPQRLTHQLATCWRRWQAAEAQAEAELTRQLEQSGAAAGYTNSSRHHLASAPSGSLVVDLAQEFAGSVSHKSFTADNPMLSTPASTRLRGSSRGTITRPNAADNRHVQHTGTQEPHGIGQNTIEGIKKFIITKIEQNSINIRPVFRKFDDDKSGHLSYDEFRRGLLHMGIPLNDKEFALLCKEVDNDGGGNIDYEEFVEDMKDNDRDRTTHYE
jgi:hypothetical protein